VKNFDFYEFTSILVPGAATIYIVSMLFPDIASFTNLEAVSVGGFGVIIILAYATGHLVAALGNVFESAYWWAFGGRPTDWVRDPRKTFLAEDQSAVLARRVAELFGLSKPKALSDWTDGSWFGLLVQIRAEVDAGNKSGRVNTFNGNYGMFRGLAAGLLACIALAPFSKTITVSGYVILIICAVLALLRMHRFGKHYACELFAQFIGRSVTTSSTEAR
jgi:hypothetical protein